MTLAAAQMLCRSSALEFETICLVNLALQLSEVMNHLKLLAFSELSSSPSYCSSAFYSIYYEVTSRHSQFIHLKQYMRIIQLILVHFE
jgi:hypothetical protein